MINRRGYIEVPMSIVSDDPTTLKQIQSDMAVTDVHLSYPTQTVRFIGRSMQFAELDPYAINLAYDWHLAPNQAVTYSNK